MSSDLAIDVRGLSKCYQIYSQPRDRLKQFILPKFQQLTGRPNQNYFQEFWALRNISFEVRKGETVGIIGRNGSGKSTLLQIICGTLNPTAGNVQTNGRIAALLELGSGFNPDFTGRENIYMNGAVLGLSQSEIDEKYDSIASFADIGDFIEQPIKTYSSGMAVRLAFAVQSQVDPDILIVDEALSVGDVKFQAKCFERLRQLKENGTSILLVTHSSEQIVSHCTKAILLHNGLQVETGEPRRIVNLYLDLLFGKAQSLTDNSIANGSTVTGDIDDESTREVTRKNSYSLSSIDDCFSKRRGYNPHEYRWGDGSATILDFYFASDNKPYPSVILTGEIITLAVSIKFHTDVYRPILGLTIKTKEGVTVYGANSETLGCDDFITLGTRDSVIQVEASFACTLAPGDYFISLGVATKAGEDVIPHDRRYDSIYLQIQPNKTFFGLVDLDLKLRAQGIDV
jgi:lipopolysaccharide transport system ATP-binding protein